MGEAEYYIESGVRSCDEGATCRVMEGSQMTSVAGPKPD